MTSLNANLVTHSAILHWPALPGPPPESLLRQVTNEIANLKALPTVAPGNLTAHCEIVSRRPAACRISVCADTSDAAMAELARLTLVLVRGHRVVRIAWLDEAAVLDRETFLRALDPAPGRPKRPPVNGPASRTASRMTPAQSQRVLENVLRMDICGPIDRSETVRIGAETIRVRRTPQGDVAGRWVAVASVVATAAVLAANAGGAAAQAISSAGFF